MKISLSPKDDPRDRHAILICARTERAEIDDIVRDEILEGRFRPVAEKLEGGETLYRFNMRYLEPLILAFPYADLSKAVHRKFYKAEEKRLANFRVPDLKIPGYKGDLYNFQKIAVALLTDPDYAREHGYNGVEFDPNSILGLEHPGGVVDLLNDEMGLGKSYIAAASIARLHAYPALLVVPNNTKYDPWAVLFEELYPKLSVAVFDTQEQDPAQRDRLLRERRDITIVNIEALRARPIHRDSVRSPIVEYEYANPALFDFRYEYAVLDEHHRIKNPDAQVTHGFFQLDAEEWWCPMSGTPVLNRVEEIWTVLHKLYPDLFPDYNTFINQIGIFGPDGRIKAYKTKAMEELRAFLQAITLRRRSDQVIKDRPKVTHKPVMVTLSKEERRIYDQIEDEMILEMENGNIKNIGGALPQITYLKEACFSPELFGGEKKSSKVEEVRKIVTEMVASGEKAIIFTQWEKAAVIMKRELEDFNPAYVTYKTKSRARVVEKNKFNEDDDCHIFIGTIGANREGINLGSATYVIFTDEGWTPAGQDQAEGRSAAGGLRGVHLPKDTIVTVIILRAEDSYEQHIETMLKKKRAITARTVERDTGKQQDIQPTSLDDLKKSLSKRAQKKLKVA